MDDDNIMNRVAN